MIICHLASDHFYQSSWETYAAPNETQPTQGLAEGDENGTLSAWSEQRSQQGGHPGTVGISAEFEEKASEHPCLGRQRGQCPGQKLRNSDSRGGVRRGG